MEQWVLYTRNLVHQPSNFLPNDYDPIEENILTQETYFENTRNYYNKRYSTDMAELPLDENEVVQFLREIKKEKWIYKFIENDITDLQTLRELKPDEWKVLELPIGARNAIEREVKERMVTVAPESPQKTSR